MQEHTELAVDRNLVFCGVVWWENFEGDFRRGGPEEATRAGSLELSFGPARSPLFLSPYCVCLTSYNELSLELSMEVLTCNWTPSPFGFQVVEKINVDLSIGIVLVGRESSVSA